MMIDKPSFQSEDSSNIDKNDYKMILTEIEKLRLLQETQAKLISKQNKIINKFLQQQQLSIKIIRSIIVND